MSDWLTIARTLSDEVAKQPPDQRLEFIRNQIVHLPAEMQELVSHFVTATMIAGGSMAQSQKDEKLFKLIAIVSGLILIIAILTLAMFVPNPTPFQYNVFRIVLSIAVAGLGAAIPGFLQVKIGRWIAATGALAIFVLVYLYNPAQLVDAAADGTEAAPANAGSR